MNTKQDLKFVSRGGLKLQHSIKNWKLEIGNYIVLDVGSSTGGFVDCLLQNGASRVYSVDTAYGELAWKLRQDLRVVVMERTNILHLGHLPVSKTQTNEIPEIAETPELVDLVTIDAGWTKLELILPVVAKFLKPGGQIIALLKPHYEADKKLLVKGVLPSEYLEQIKNDVLFKIKNLKFKIIGELVSPILGGGGNQEFLLLITSR